MKLLIIEHEDPDLWNDVELMVVPNDFDTKFALEQSSFPNPHIANTIDLKTDWKFLPLIALGEYRPFLSQKE